MTGEDVPAGERGSTRIADRVVAKIAAQAAREALRGDSPEGPGRQDGRGGAEEAGGPDGAGGAGARGGALPDGTRPAPRATVTVRDQSARVRVALELGYPSDIGAQCGAVRRRVAFRVRELAGMEVPDVALDVERLHSVHLKGKVPGRVT
ncbi:MULTISPECIES: Asp23/Gls24 family envelope stress response protein [unclassified Streptomyces]|uniref:Asp23/Gls24 family envelope stress response protein n=1 Tax=unclassified Streptomyces TaxID=2593676 RepID=UPI002DDC6A92|nr:Asp23/Gls24 family envelope stress response protein [Streptomyces sp. NBC_01795]WSA95673.1 Asp23/Gls24 family envelope stress response protein [Streptomyces sp. NBC_01795]WSS40413.1 Asp23/Gls24 family envelope stress response protein [Streptomyces sp. NBC_01187]